MHIEKCPHCGSTNIFKYTYDFCADCGNSTYVSDSLFLTIDKLSKTYPNEIEKYKQTTDGEYSFFVDYNKICKKAANEAILFFGTENQKTKAVEELAELQKELCKDLTGEGNHENILEEISDVCFMILQLTQIYNFSVDDIIYELSHKIARLQTRMNE